MHVVLIQVFASLMLVGGSLVLLAYSVRHADYEHADRLALLPMERDEAPQPPKTDAP
jgi:uncharacterized membrane protein